MGEFKVENNFLELSKDFQYYVEPDNEVQYYLNAIKNYKILSREDELRFLLELENANEIMKAHQDGLEILVNEEYLKRLPARIKFLEDRLFRSCAKFVVSLAKKYNGLGLPLIDVIQEGNEGLLIAIRRFRLSKSNNGKLSNIAAYWIKQRMAKAIIEKGRMIKLPHNQIAKLNNLKKVQKLLFDKLGEDPSIEDIVAFTGKSESKIKELLSFPKEGVSLDTQFGEDGDSAFIDWVHDSRIDVEGEIVSSIYESKVGPILEDLAERDRFIIEMRFGFRGEILTFEEIGDMVGLTRERIRQIEKDVINRLRSNKEVKKLA